MTITFTAGLVALANWSFSAGDVAVIAGAGHKAGTWMLAQFKGRALFDWMNMDVDVVFTWTLELHKRWDKKITLIKMARRPYSNSRGGIKVLVVQGLGRFTWLMILFTAALEASCR
ncbi:hypothetical protein K469DRAFT_125103 [Zopfia rhizophila CBS 207.26]|uniref:Uncharacterized protein n=1 Tax=Zopfia rhizophila CBS 207.26 TaxID=1314779 RepID=A0A6A6E9C7_9PEZI|nr:hypothetical protein K469DRAFT_125103 [Zopfia rhizophila CBS 207.26]